MRKYPNLGKEWGWQYVFRRTAAAQLRILNIGPSPSTAFCLPNVFEANVRTEGIFKPQVWKVPSSSWFAYLFCFCCSIFNLIFRPLFRIVFLQCSLRWLRQWSGQMQLSRVFDIFLALRWVEESRKLPWCKTKQRYLLGTIKEGMRPKTRLHR